MLYSAKVKEKRKHTDSMEDVAKSTVNTDAPSAVLLHAHAGARTL
jgi:hypothetical protein